MLLSSLGVCLYLAHPLFFWGVSKLKTEFKLIYELFLIIPSLCTMSMFDHKYRSIPNILCVFYGIVLSIYCAIFLTMPHFVACVLLTILVTFFDDTVPMFGQADFLVIATAITYVNTDELSSIKIIVFASVIVIASIVYGILYNKVKHIKDFSISKLYIPAFPPVCISVAAASIAELLIRYGSLYSIFVQ